MKIIILEIILLETNMFNINQDCFDAASPEIIGWFYFKLHGSDLLENCLCEKQVRSQEQLDVVKVPSSGSKMVGGKEPYPPLACIN